MSESRDNAGGASAVGQPPSRHSNPFATCWTRPGAVPFLFPAGQSAGQLVDRLAQRGWRGEIIGPHGSGKSTLLATLMPMLEEAGRQTLQISLAAGQRQLPREALAGVDRKRGESSRGVLLVVDGFEQLSWLARLRVRRACHRAAAGLLVTAHRSVGLPTLVRLAPDLETVERVVAAICPRGASPVVPGDIAASHACHGSNVREILFDLYDLHQRRWRVC